MLSIHECQPQLLDETIERARGQPPPPAAPRASNLSLNNLRPFLRHEGLAPRVSDGQKVREDLLRGARRDVTAAEHPLPG